MKTVFRLLPLFFLPFLLASCGDKKNLRKVVRFSLMNRSIQRFQKTKIVQIMKELVVIWDRQECLLLIFSKLELQKT